MLRKGRLNHNALLSKIMSAEEPLAERLAEPIPYANKGDLTRGDIGGHLVRLTVPMIWGLLAVISIQLANTYFISQLGTK